MTPPGGAQLLEAGTILGGRYVLERRIAAGGMATIWLGRDEELQRPIAVKVLSDVLAEDPAYVARFQREAQLAAGLSHPNLVRVFDFSKESERPYLVMEYVDAGTLADRIAANRADEVDPRRLARELLGALALIHRAGVVHRDVKPSNVLLDQGGRARLTDFGIAEPRDATKLTRTGEVIGTLKYMAPEVRRGEPATPRSDLYSCGVLLGEALQGTRTSGVAALAAQLTRADPAARPATAEAAASQLDTAPVATAPTRPLEASADTGITREIHITGRRIAIGSAALALGAVVAILALAGGSGGGPSKAHRPKPTTSTAVHTSTFTTTVSAAPAPVPAPAPAKPPKAKGPSAAGGLPPGQAKKEGGGE
jgi:eukaryotic-like serine/threonine-protein kinase